MRLTARQLNRALLGRQMLLHREAMPAAEAVRKVVALQAQEPASPYIGLWNRLEPFDPAGLDRAFAEHEVVKAPLMRITLHAVHKSDYPAFHEAMQVSLRPARLHDRRFKRAGLSIDEADALVPPLLEFASEHRTNGEMEAWIDRRLGEHPKPSVWWALRTFAPLEHAPTGAPWTFGPRPSYVAAVEQVRPGDRAASLRFLIRRYLEAFGPATLQDFCQFALVYRSVAAGPFRDLAGDLETFKGPDGGELFDISGGPLPPENEPAPPRLMAMWDNSLLGHVDRGRIIPPEYRRIVARVNGDVLPTLLVDGYVAGVWRPVSDGIEATAFHRLPAEVWDGLQQEAAALMGFLASREPMVYSRYYHWWKELPAAEVRVLGSR